MYIYPTSFASLKNPDIYHKRNLLKLLYLNSQYMEESPCWASSPFPMFPVEETELLDWLCILENSLEWRHGKCRQSNEQVAFERLQLFYG